MLNANRSNSVTPKMMKISDLNPSLQPLARQISGGKAEVSTAAVDSYIEREFVKNEDDNKNVPFINGTVDNSDLLVGVNGKRYHEAEVAVKLREAVKEGDTFEPAKEVGFFGHLLGKFLAPSSTPTSIFNSEGLLKNDWWK